MAEAMLQESAEAFLEACTGPRLQVLACCCELVSVVDIHSLNAHSETSLQKARRQSWSSSKKKTIRDEHTRCEIACAKLLRVVRRATAQRGYRG